MPEKIRPSPYDSPELYDLLFDSLDFDVAYWLEVGRGAGGPVLELACGSGRLLLPIRRAGVDIDGLDASPAMISRLRERARAEGLEVRAEVADMRDFSMSRLYARIFCGFNGFAHCETIDDQLGVLRCARRHLLPGGALVLHMSYPGPGYWLEGEDKPVLEHEAPRPGGGKLQLWDDRRKDIVAQRQDSEVEIWELDAEERPVAAHAFKTHQRWVYRFELELLLRTAGFERQEFFGGFDGRPLRTPEDQMIAWAYPRA